MKKTLLFIAAFLIGLIGNSTFAANNDEPNIDWSQVDDIWEWGLHLNMIYYEDIVLFDGVMYQCTKAEGTYAYSYMWNPTAWEAPNYQTIAPVTVWEIGISIAEGAYITHNDKLYRCIKPGGITAGTEPGNAPTDYEELATINPSPLIEYPQNFVAVWDDYNSWQPGFIVIYMADENVYKCTKATTVMGEQLPGLADSEYWSASLGSAQDILNIPDVTIPDWDDLRIWIIGSIVKHEGKYYRALSQTHKGEDEFPGGTGGYWSEIDFSSFGNQLPADYVGYWHDNMVWKPAYHAIYNGKVYECNVETHKGGGENPETTWGYWNNTPKGNEEDLLKIGITIPAWDDLRSWPEGAVVSYNGNYYKCQVQTHKGGGEHPETPWGYWTKLDLSSSITGLDIENLKYHIDNGRFIVDTETNIALELYNSTGQVIKTSQVNYIDLPQKGLYIAKITIDGKSSAIKVLW